MPKPNDVGVGVAIALVRPDGCVLLGRRKGAHGAGQWSFPGGWIDRTDLSIEAACIREVWEEVGIHVAHSRRLTEASTDFPSYGFRSITLFRVVEVTDEQAVAVQNLEPEKCEEWRWFSLSMVPTDLFGGVAAALMTLGLFESGRLPIHPRKLEGDL